MITMTKRWDDVRAALDDTLAITFDGCHKIYLLLDEQQVREFREYEYDVEDVTDIDQALDALKDWYQMSCFLRFITAVRTNETDPNAGYEDLIPQGAEAEEEW